MSQKSKARRRLKVWQRLLLAAVILIPLGLSSTLFSDASNPRLKDDLAAIEATGSPAWKDSVYGYVVSEEGDLTVPFYNEALAEKGRCGRGTYIEMESWDPFVAEDGTEYYHVFFNGVPGYILCTNISDDKSDIIQETQVYVRTTVNLTTEPDGLTIGNLARKGELLRIMGYDYITESGKVNMYEVKLGTEIGWIHSDYVSSTYAEALENWNNDANVYNNHVLRGDPYGGGNASELDFWPHEKADFSSKGNVMPDSCYCLYVPVEHTTPAMIRQYLDLAEGTAINTFVIGISEGAVLAYDSPFVDSYEMLNYYKLINSQEQFQEAMDMVREAGYFTVARISAFRDTALAQAKPEWCVTDLRGVPLDIKNSNWPSVYCRDVWEFKVGLALEAVDTYGFNEVQFDYVRFPDYILNYEEDGTADLKNVYGESKAQAIQRFLIYAKDLVHAHGAYVSATVLGETSNNYVAPCGQYWDAISTVVDVISGTPYPDEYASGYVNGVYFRYYTHPYATVYDWGVHVYLRQSECSSPAIVRTCVQIWDSPGYHYGSAVITREIAALYDAKLTGGYIPWYSAGSITLADNLRDVINIDFYSLYLESLDTDDILSVYMGLDTKE